MTFTTGGLTFNVGDPITYTDSSSGNRYSGFVGKLSNANICFLDDDVLKAKKMSPAEYCSPNGAGQSWASMKKPEKGLKPKSMSAASTSGRPTAASNDPYCIVSWPSTLGIIKWNAYFKK